MPDVCTINADLLHLMDKPNIETWCCAVCGAERYSDRHHIVKRSEGKWITDGKAHSKPTVTLCRHCHDLAHQGLLWFDWRDGWMYLKLTKDRARWEEAMHPEWGGKIGYSNARQLEGWRRIV